MSIVSTVRYAAAAVLMCVGAFFFFVGTLGLIRFPDFYSRTHGATKCDTVGAGSILLGLCVLRGFEADVLKILAIVALVLLTSPTAGHALARAAYRTGLRPWTHRIGGGESDDA